MAILGYRISQRFPDRQTRLATLPSLGVAQRKLKPDIEKFIAHRSSQ
jgi:hypothetical protein